MADLPEMSEEEIDFRYGFRYYISMIIINIY